MVAVCPHIQFHLEDAVVAGAAVACGAQLLDLNRKVALMEGQDLHLAPQCLQQSEPLVQCTGWRLNTPIACIFPHLHILVGRNNLINNTTRSSCSRAKYLMPSMEGASLKGTWGVVLIIDCRMGHAHGAAIHSFTELRDQR